MVVFDEGFDPVLRVACPRSFAGVLDLHLSPGFVENLRKVPSLVDEMFSVRVFFLCPV